ncbi:MAG: single-stranded DNA-binding protein [Bacteroidales bacterium]
MAGVNKVILLGNLGKDPEIRNLERGAKVANFPLATNRVYKGQDGQKVEETEWHNVVLWGGLADLAEKFLSKGRQVFIEGRIRTRNWDDKDGVKRYITEVVGENMTFVGGRDQGGSMPPSDGDYPKGASEAEQSAEEDDLPF